VVFNKFELNKVEETPTSVPIVFSYELRQRLKYLDPYPLGTLKAKTAGLLTTGENVVREKYGEITLNPPFNIPVIIIPSKAIVLIDFLETWQLKTSSG